MERLWKAAFTVGGVAAIGAFVFWSLYKEWLSLPIFSQITAEQTFVVMLVFLGLTFLSLLAAFALHIIGGRSPDDAFPLYEKFREGLSSPEENIAQIERVANSSDPKKEKYLREAASLPSISFIEVDAINQALEDISKKKIVSNLKERMRQKEIARIKEMLPISDDPMFKPIMISSKYWRYVNRKNHPQYKKMNNFIGIVLVKGFNEEAIALSRELENEFRSVS
ncbi:hypothetical protein [Pseudomonas sp. SC3(2021)]|uniref:hypothetical protein n=1 Tax=Pseudomonas sp. SC3(2021) TaxID=2871493 RepID=UPI001C9D8793|nr:hypothetical protein [Pseudomonas sp. SC3(2021)]